MKPWIIVGQGLAGTCLAWQFHLRGVPFLILDSEQGGSSRIAAGMINPITGKNFQPSWQVAHFLPQAVSFYQSIEAILNLRFWHTLPILRLAQSAQEWDKISAKLAHPDVSPWVGQADQNPAPPWIGSVIVNHGGRLDTRVFLDASREFFRTANRYRPESVTLAHATDHHIWCDGAAGLIAGHFDSHRCAKGEILTLRAPAWDATTIRIGANGWLVPVGNGHFKCGSTYDRDHLSMEPTTAGREKISSIARLLGGEDFAIVDHLAGVRPILRRSEPFIGPWSNGWMFNGLGSKGSLYAPGFAALLAAWLIDGNEPERVYDIRFRSL